MPRGFLVKRSRRPGGSYRARPREQDPDRDPPPAPPPPPPPPPSEEGAAAACPATWPPGGGCSGPGVTPPEGPAAWGATGPCSVAGPRAALFERCLSSPASAESFPLAASFPPAEKLLLQPRTPLPAPPPPPVPALKRPSRAKTPAKKGKATRKLSFADEVTTSPVLGLRIKEEGPEGRPGPPAGRTPLGEFICQLCKEQYADPLALAQHRCSRIVRVEYRCPECHKIFSCPANLASHRRWHKPRPGPSADGAAAAPPGKENSPERRLRGPAAPPPQPPPPTRQHRGGADSAGGAPAAPGPGLGPAHGGAPGPGGEAFACPCCQKRFRRQAYLRKHLGTHGAARPAAFGPPERGPLAFACHLCGARFPSADIRDKHRLWHAVREELLLPPPPPAGVPEGGAAGGERQGFPCKHCPATFFSAPGLARHASKCHPPESRQVLLLQVPVRPGC
ncbi:PREDICTED: insulinoma-associated protein 2 [Lepidothrix coronata]|uniref:Insulinoma-associated protein 2 n=1 Tax=Lepidothrix coronata TaxID=321398 RepID=A0A6J0IFM4_9PASS|nr:PREDICTED: insulinoma-associated protein 2 [Lepidothrix coronata]